MNIDLKEHIKQISQIFPLQGLQPYGCPLLAPPWACHSAPHAKCPLAGDPPARGGHPYIMLPQVEEAPTDRLMWS